MHEDNDNSEKTECSVDESTKGFLFLHSPCEAIGKEDEESN
jgi:hypothetical protein